MSFRSAYARGVDTMGAMMFDGQLARGEKMVTDATAAVDRAANSVHGVKSALIVNAVITGVSTAVLVASVARARKGSRRG